MPDLPGQRRTDRDVPANAMFQARAKSSGFFLEAAIQPGLQRPRLVSSYEGSIDRILFAFPSSSLSVPARIAGYQSVIAALRKGTRFVVVHSDDSAVKRVIESWFDAAGHAKDAVQFVPLPPYVTFTDWAEDGYVALHDAADGCPYLMEPWEFPRAGDALIAEAISEFTDYKTGQAPLIFQGGNCLIGDEFWLLGKDYFADSVRLATDRRPPVEVPPGTAPEALIVRMFKDYVDAQRKLVLVGTRKPIPLRSFYGGQQDGAYFLDIPSEGAGTYQPIFHIDMFITFLGKTSTGQFGALVGSPRMADQLLGTRSPFALDSVYDTIANDLSQQGIAVTRNPLVHRAQVGQEWPLARLKAEAASQDGDEMREAIEELVASGATDASPVKIRSWHHITWNNCLVEVSAARGNHVYLPTYGHGKYADLARIDEVMMELWVKQGFTVHALADFNDFARRQGVVHCIKKYLERGA